MSDIIIKLRINGKVCEFQVSPLSTLLDVIRDKAGLTGTKKGCGLGQCGACTVILNGRAVNSCCILAVQADNSTVFTIEGLQEGEVLHPIQQAYVDEGAIQCGFCTPGMIMSTKALLDHNPDPDEAQIREALSGNLCRCTGYKKIEKAVKAAAAAVNSKTAAAVNSKTAAAIDSGTAAAVNSKTATDVDSKTATAVSEGKGEDIYE